MDTMSPINGGRRTGATWVAATGAFLLLAAATMFVATRWDQIPDGAKLAALVGITGACVLAGDRLRKSLPATGNALFHLGALLIPIDVVALGMRTSMSWQELLLVDGLISTALLAICAWRASSVVLAATASAGVLVSAGGIAAVTGIPAPFALAVFAVVACFVPKLERHAFTWAGVAAIAPLALVVLDRAITGNGVARELGLFAVAWPWSVATVALVSVVVARGARLRNEPPLMLIALAAIAAHGIALWRGTDTPHLVDVLAAPAFFLLAELAVLAVRRDPFWARPAHIAAQVLEALVAVPTILAVYGAFAFVALSELGFGDTRDLAIAAGVGALGWIVAEGRRRTRSWAPLPAAAALTLFAVALATGSAAALAGAAIVIGAAAAVMLTRERMMPLAFAAAGYATVAGLLDERTALLVSVGAAAVFVLAVFRADPRLHSERVTGLALALVAVGFGERVGAEFAGLLIAALVWPVVCWLVALVADEVDQRIGDVIRAIAFFVLPFLVGGAAIDVLPAALALTLLSVSDEVRTRRTLFAYAAIAPMIVCEIALAALAGLDVATGGVALCVAASVWLGSAAFARSPWREPLAAAAGVSAFVGLLGASASAMTFGPALTITGVLALSIGLMLDEVLVAHVGGGVATVGVWITLAARDVVVSELYVAPVALQLLLAGIALRTRVGDRRPSSWVAYGPAIALLASCALAERIAGGPAWHSMVAGAIGVMAVAVGGWKRALAPLLLGTGTLVAVVVREMLDSNAGIPTWVWLAVGGAALIGAAVAMERKDVSPVEAGRRVVDVLGSHFD
jgi:hypothetical protein